MGNQQPVSELNFGELKRSSTIPKEFKTISMAAASCSVEKLKSMMEKGAKIDELQHGSNGMESALHVAVRHDNVKIIPFLLEHLPQFLNDTTLTRIPPLCLTKSLAAAKLLVEAGADVNPNIDITSPLNCNIDMPDVVKYLLEHKSDPRVRKPLCQTPLYRAVDSCLIDTIRVLLDFDPDLVKLYYPVDVIERTGPCEASYTYASNELLENAIRGSDRGEKRDEVIEMLIHSGVPVPPNIVSLPSASTLKEETIILLLSHIISSQKRVTIHHLVSDVNRLCHSGHRLLRCASSLNIISIHGKKCECDLPSLREQSLLLIRLQQ